MNKNNSISIYPIQDLYLNTTVFIGDPCYASSDNVIVTDDFMPGVWKIDLIRKTIRNDFDNTSHDRIDQMVAYCTDGKGNPLCKYEDIKDKFDEIDYSSVFVDSGTMAIGNFQYWCTTHKTNELCLSWWRKLCDLWKTTNQENPKRQVYKSGIIDYEMAYCESGVGDGTYEVNIYKDPETLRIIGVKIDFDVDRMIGIF